MIITDGLQNLVSGIGTDKDKSSHYRYDFQSLPADQIGAMYRSGWLAKKLVNIIPADMTREWRTWQSEQAEAIYQVEKQFRVQRLVCEALTWERAYGGAAILIGTGDPDPSQPLDVMKIRKDGIKYLTVLTRNQMQAEGLGDDIMSESFGKPEFYTVSNVKIHRSRFAIFDGSLLASEDRKANQGWGDSLLDSLGDAVKQADAACANASALMNEAKVDVIEVPDLADALSTPDGEDRLKRRFNLANMLKSAINMLLIGGGEKHTTKQVNFAGIPDMVRMAMQNASSGGDIPVTRLLAQSPAGLNATGDADTRNYYDKLKSDQSSYLTPAMWPLDQALVRHTLGDWPDGTAYEWNPLWQMTPAEKADIDNKNAQTDKIYADMGVFSEEAVQGAIRDKLIANNTYPTLDQHLNMGQEGDEGGDGPDGQD